MSYLTQDKQPGPQSSNVIILQEAGILQFEAELSHTENLYVVSQTVWWKPFWVSPVRNSGQVLRVPMMLNAAREKLQAASGCLRP